MKKVQIFLTTLASLIGIVAASAFAGPNQTGGWRNGVHYVKGTAPGQYWCEVPPNNITCTYVDKEETRRFDTGLFIIH